MNDGQATLVIGIGNPLRGDDGAGAYVAKRVAEQSLRDVQVRTVHQLTPELAPVIAAAARVVFIDAAIEPESALPRCHRVEIGDRGAGLTHRVEPGQICALAKFIYGSAPEAHVVSVPIRAAGFGDGLSREVRDCADAALDLVLALLSEGPRSGSQSRC